MRTTIVQLDCIWRQNILKFHYLVHEPYFSLKKSPWFLTALFSLVLLYYTRLGYFAFLKDREGLQSIILNQSS